MKNINEAKKDLNNYLKSEKPQKSKIEFYKTAILFLSSNPTKIYCQSEMKKLYNKIDVFNNRFDEWNKSTRNIDEPRKHYEKINDYATIYLQLDFFKYILNLD